jgi:hypothetical protein
VSRLHQPSMLTALAVGSEDELCRPCVDCGLVAGRFCDGEEVETSKGVWSGAPCFAKDRLPTQIWVDNQRTPLCSRCDSLHGKCCYCRGGGATYGLSSPRLYQPSIFHLGRTIAARTYVARSFEKRKSVKTQMKHKSSSLDVGEKGAVMQPTMV